MQLVYKIRSFLSFSNLKMEIYFSFDSWWRKLYWFDIWTIKNKNSRYSSVAYLGERLYTDNTDTSGFAFILFYVNYINSFTETI